MGNSTLGNKRQLIELSQEYLIECDNTVCDYKIKNDTGNPYQSIRDYINDPCPLCGENLLTQADYDESERVLRIISWINKWFSWIMLFVPKKTKMSDVGVKVHNGIKITNHGK